MSRSRKFCSSHVALKEALQ
ncbi:hypothetical protein A2U01_0067829, partial [Trifolium medium]|nr:hypothetical protein [Trifolium medium]